MEQTIWKFPIMGKIANDGQGDYFDINMSEQATPLAVQVQHGEPQMWVRTPSDAILPDHDTPPRRFYICGTGHKLHPQAGKHLDTFQMHGGGLVFHVFEGAPDA